MKKGFTLLELIIALSVASILITIETNLLSRQSINFEKFISEDRENSYCMEALRFIEGEINALDNKKVLISNNEITILKNNDDKNTIKCVKQSNGKLKVVMVYDPINKVRNTSVAIVENVDEFKIEENKNIIFVSICTDGGKKYERCFGIEEEKVL